jgi:type IV pilus assembly protein PilW
MSMSFRSSPLLQHRPQRSRGFTLVELMVALTVGMIILLALTLVFSRNNSNLMEVEKTGRQMENGRFALDMLGEEVRHAGFYGEVDPDNLAVTYTTPAPCETDLTKLGWDTSTASVKMPAAILGTSDASTLPCLSNAVGNSEAVTFRYLDTGDEVSTASVKAGNLYIQISRCSSDALQLASGYKTDDFKTLRNLACSASYAYVRRYRSRTYYVASCDDCGGGDGIPTLKRVELVDGTLTTSAVAEGVEKLVVEYGVDTDSDGVVDKYTDSTTLNKAVAPVLWTNVIDVRLHVLSRNTETSPGYTDPRTYTMGSVNYTPADAYKRTLLRATARLTNIGNRRDSKL